MNISYGAEATICRLGHISLLWNTMPYMQCVSNLDRFICLIFRYVQLHHVQLQLLPNSRFQNRYFFTWYWKRITAIVKPNKTKTCAFMGYHENRSCVQHKFPSNLIFCAVVNLYIKVQDVYFDMVFIQKIVSKNTFWNTQGIIWYSTM